MKSTIVCVRRCVSWFVCSCLLLSLFSQGATSQTMRVIAVNAEQPNPRTLGQVHYLPAQTGAAIPFAEGTEAIELYLVGDEEGRPTEPTLLATYENDGTKPQVRNLSAKPQSGGAGPDASAYLLEVTWEATGSAKVRYKVEVSTDGLKDDSPLKKWMTVANNLSQNLTKIPRIDEQAPGLKELQVRVTAYDGFRESVTTKSIKLR